MPNETVFDEYRKMFESRISAGATEKLWSFSGYFPGILLHCWNISGTDVWVAVDVVVEKLFVWVVEEIVDVVVAVEVASQSQRASSRLSVCTAAEEDATGCKITEPLGMTGPAADSVFGAAGPPGSCFALWLPSASVGAEWERLVPAASHSLFALS